MAEQWRVIDLCEFQGRLHSVRGGIEVCPEDGQPVTLPVAELAVVLVGMKVDLSAAVLHRLSEADVAVLFCDWRGIPEGACYSWSFGQKLKDRLMSFRILSARAVANSLRSRTKFAQVTPTILRPVQHGFTGPVFLMIGGNRVLVSSLARMRVLIMDMPCCVVM